MVVVRCQVGFISMEDMNGYHREWAHVGRGCVTIAHLKGVNIKCTICSSRNSPTARPEATEMPLAYRDGGTMGGGGGSTNRSAAVQSVPLNLSNTRYPGRRSHLRVGAIALEDANALSSNISDKTIATRSGRHARSMPFARGKIFFCGL